MDLWDSNSVFAIKWILNRDFLCDGDDTAAADNDDDEDNIKDGGKDSHNKDYHSH